MELRDNQAALILTESNDGEITVDITSPHMESLAGLICQAIAKKMIQDVQFIEDLMDMLE